MNTLILLFALTGAQQDSAMVIIPACTLHVSMSELESIAKGWDELQQMRGLSQAFDVVRYKRTLQERALKHRTARKSLQKQ